MRTEKNIENIKYVKSSENQDVAVAYCSKYMIDHFFYLVFIVVLLVLLGCLCQFSRLSGKCLFKIIKMYLMILYLHGKN